MTKHDIVTEGVKAAPPLTVIAVDSFTSFDVNSAIKWFTLIYIVLQIGFLLWKWYRSVRDESSGARFS